MSVGYASLIVTTLIIVVILVSYGISFERRKPGAKELVMISTLSAIAIVSRVAFIWIPHFKPMLGIIMLSAILLGPYKGFMIGAISVFVSNMIFGQGPWTPWQMLDFGLCASIIGALFRRSDPGDITFSRTILIAIIGFIVTVLIAGPLLDIYSMMSFLATFNYESVLGVLLAGFPVNLMHGCAVFLTLLIFTKPAMRIFSRLELKYGLKD